MAQHAKTFHVERPFRLHQDHDESLHLLYLPLIGSLALSVYTMMVHLCDSAHQKSAHYPQSYLLDALAQSPNALQEALETLEASALLKTYELESHYTYFLQEPMSPKVFAKSALFPYLKANISQDRVLDLKDRLRLNATFKPQGKDISKRFDERFKPLKTQSKAQTIQARASIDVDQVLRNIPLTILAEKERSADLEQVCSQVAFLYDLSERQLNEILLKALAEKKPLDALTLTQMAHPHVKPQPSERSYRSDSEYFQSVHPKKLIADLTGTTPVAGDLRIVDRLLTEVAWPLEVTNVLLAYVIHELDMQMPAYGYFEKVIAQWNRKHIRTAQEALEHIQKQKAKQKEPKPSSPPRRKSKQSVEMNVDWFKDYLKQQEGEKE